MRRRILVIIPSKTGGSVITDGGDRADLLKALNVTSITRAGTVDPVVSPKGIQFYADLSHSAGPKLGPYPTKDAAVQAEISHLIQAV